MRLKSNLRESLRTRSLKRKVFALCLNCGIALQLAPILKIFAQAPIENSSGPTQPIGPSLKTPEALRRIKTLIGGRRETLAQLSKGEGNAPANTIKTDPFPSDPTAPPLVGGQYGFNAPTTMEGVPKAFVSLGDSLPAYGIVVEKLHHRLSLFKLNERNEYELVKTLRAITGKDPGDKVTRGDLRTPEGIYFVTGEMKDAELPAKYGRLAFTLDYPNIYDQRQRKSGYGIWIHSTDDPKRLEKPFDTEGCVVLSNEDIIDLKKYISPFEIPVIITKEMSTVKAEDLEEPRRKALEMVESWRNSWQTSDFDSYMGYYSKNFKSLGKGRNQWENYKKNISELRSKNIKISISKPKIVAFEDQLLVVFQQDYTSQQHNDFGRKFLYLQWEGDRYRIIAEKWYAQSKTETVLRPIKPIGRQM